MPIIQSHLFTDQADKLTTQRCVCSWLL